MPSPRANLLLWNPRKFAWDTPHSHAWCVKETLLGRGVPFRWRVGPSRSIACGDRLFLFKTGRGRGLVGAGRATADPPAGGRSRYVDLCFEQLLPVEDALPVEWLAAATTGVAWSHQYASGTRLSPGDARIVEALWQDHWQSKRRPGLPEQRLARGDLPNLALSIRQPHAEAILRGVKTEEFRAVATTVRGQVCIYAPRSRYEPAQEQQYLASYGRPLAEVDLDALCHGFLVGVVEIVDCRPRRGEYAWQLARPARLTEPLKPRGMPQPMWFRPF